MSIDSKFRKAASACLESGAIYLDGDSFAFSHGGAQSFIEELVPTLATDEKHVFLNEYVLTWSDEQTDEVCEYLQSDSVNPLKKASRKAAIKILESDEIQRHLSEDQREIDMMRKSRSVYDQFNEVFKGEAA